MVLVPNFLAWVGYFGEAYVIIVIHTFHGRCIQKIKLHQKENTFAYQTCIKNQRRPESGVRPICSRCPHGRAILPGRWLGPAPFTAHCASCIITHDNWTWTALAEMRSKVLRPCRGSGVGISDYTKFWSFADFKLCFHWLRLAAVICSQYMLCQLGDFGLGPSPEAHGGKQETHWGKQETHWRQPARAGSRDSPWGLKVRSFRNYEMLRAVVVDHFSWGTEGEMICFASGEVVSVSWCQMATGTPIHSHTTHYTPWFKRRWEAKER